MKIKKDEVVTVSHQRTGKWIGKATRDFDTEKTEFYPLVLHQDDMVQGASTYWKRGDDMPARNTLCRIIKSPILYTSKKEK